MFKKVSLKQVEREYIRQLVFRKNHDTRICFSYLTVYERCAASRARDGVPDETGRVGAHPAPIRMSRGPAQPVGHAGPGARRAALCVCLYCAFPLP